ncbi:hypothetical protein [Limnospira fusiformis]|uniref:hypothetical protein n=1 Tax=Limnospira fusiformis TaxID=54297 RepID=UPI002AA0FC6C|nr:hypothetical protein [Limnospira fusiformis LS22]
MTSTQPTQIGKRRSPHFFALRDGGVGFRTSTQPTSQNWRWVSWPPPNLLPKTHRVMVGAVTGTLGGPTACTRETEPLHQEHGDRSSQVTKNKGWPRVDSQGMSFEPLDLIE